MLAFLRRLKERFQKSGPRPGANAVSRSAPPVETTRLIRLTLKPHQLPALIILVLVNVALIVAATLFAAQLLREAPLVSTLPTLTPFSSVTAVNPEATQALPPLNITASPPPAGPTPTAPPNPLTLGGTIFYAYRNGGHTNLWAQVLGRPKPQRLTTGPWDDREPAVSPDGARLAFASRRDGSWNLYILNLQTGDVKQLTTGVGFKANPHWSPDNQYLVFEWYRNNNLDIAIINSAGGDMIPLTDNPAADYEPAWSPGAGREIVWVSMRSGNPDLWLRSLDNALESSSHQLTYTPNVQEAEPVFSANGQMVAYTDAASPLGLVYALPSAKPDAGVMEAGQGQHPVWSPDGSSLLTVAPQANGQDYLLIAPVGQYGLGQIAYKSSGGRIGATDWSHMILPETLPGSMGLADQVVDAPLWSETISQPQSGDPPYALVPLPGVSAPDPRLSDRVDDAFTGLRRTMAQAVGWDFLATLNNATVSLKAPPPPAEDYNSWLKTGRAFDFSQAVNQAGWAEISRENYGVHTYWRVWVRTVQQDGSLGEPLRHLPWNFSARYSGRPGPYDAGGEYYAVLPPGFFVDFTTLAEDFGWARIPAQENWTAYYPGILYWRFEHRDGLDWLAALREVYTAAEAATQTPVPSPTSTPTITNTPTETYTPSNTPTQTPSQTYTRGPTRTRRPTLTPSPTITRRPTITTTPSLTRRPTRTLTPTLTRRPTLTLTPTITSRWYSSLTRTAEALQTLTPQAPPSETPLPPDAPTASP